MRTTSGIARHHLATYFVILSLVLSVPTQGLGQGYTATEIGAEALSGERSLSVNEISDSGTVIGDLFDDLELGGPPSAFFSSEAVYVEGSFVNIHEPQWGESRGIDLNGDGQILISLTNPVGDFLRQVDGTLVTLAPLSGYPRVKLSAISERGGIVVGQSYGGELEPRATFWFSYSGAAFPVDGDLNDELGGWSLSNALHVSPDGRYITGYARNNAGNVDGTFLVEVVNNQVEILEIIPDTLEHLYVNSHGTIAGTMVAELNAQFFKQAFVKELNDELTVIGAQAQFDSVAQGLNDCNQVSGYFETLETPIGEPFLWDPEVGLQDLLPLLPSSTVQSATIEGRTSGNSLNNRGQYVINGFTGVPGGQRGTAWVFSPTQPYECIEIVPPQVFAVVQAQAFVLGAGQVPLLEETPLCQHIQSIVDSSGTLEAEVVYWINQCTGDGVSDTCRPSANTEEGLSTFQRLTQWLGIESHGPPSEDCVALIANDSNPNAYPINGGSERSIRTTAPVK